MDTRKENPAIRKAIDALDVKTAAELARLVGVRPQAVDKWLRGRAPAERCRAIEEATGGAVTRYELRPDVFGKAPAEPKRKRAA